MKKIFLACYILMAFILQSPAYAATPLETAREDVNKVLEILRDKTASKEVKKKNIEDIYGRMFDEVELSKRSMGKGWTALNSSEQKEFVKLFREILKKAYIDKILSYSDEKIDFTGETKLSESQAEVQTRVITSSEQIPINYRMIMKNDTWKVYDVVVENVSLIRNYRSQFRSILSKNTPEQLLEILRKKVEKE